MTLADIDALINVSIRGVVIATQEALVHMSTADALSISVAVWQTAWRCRVSPSTP